MPIIFLSLALCVATSLFLSLIVRDQCMATYNAGFQNVEFVFLVINCKIILNDQNFLQDITVLRFSSFDIIFSKGLLHIFFCNLLL